MRTDDWTVKTWKLQLSLTSRVSNTIHSRLLLPIGQTRLIIRDFSRLLVHQEDVAMQTYNSVYKIKLPMEEHLQTEHQFSATDTSLVSWQVYPLSYDSIQSVFHPQNTKYRTTVLSDNYRLSLPINLFIRLIYSYIYIY
jgi:hypothetical protein